MSKQNDAARLVLVVLGILVLVLAWRVGSRYFGGRQTVWVAQSDLTRGEVLRPAQLGEERRSASAAPAAALSQSEIVGKKLARDKKEGQPFVAGDIAKPRSTSLAERVPQGRVMYTLRIGGASVPFRELRAGDRMDILAVGTTRTGSRAIVVAHDAMMLGYLADETPRAEKRPSRLPLGLSVEPGSRKSGSDGAPPLVLAVYPEDVFSLAEVDPSRIRIVVHRNVKGDDGRLTAQVVDLARPPDVKQVELILGTERSQVSFQ